MDYLTRLIQRTAQGTPAVQPLLRPRYAPEEAETLPPEETAEEALAEAAPSSDTGVAPVVPRAVAPGEARPLRDMDATQRGAAFEVVIEQAVEGPPTASVPPVEAASENVVARPAAPESPTVPRPLRPEEAFTPVFPVRDTVGGPEQTAVHGPGQPAGDAADELLMPQRVEDEREAPAPAATPPIHPLNGREMPHGEPPVVRVTIGRIDVRTAPSMPAPAPAPRPEPAAPRLGLDEYLRNGGRG